MLLGHLLVVCLELVGHVDGMLNLFAAQGSIVRDSFKKPQVASRGFHRLEVRQEQTLHHLGGPRRLSSGGERCIKFVAKVFMFFLNGRWGSPLHRNGGTGGALLITFTPTPSSTANEITRTSASAIQSLL